MNVSPVSFGSLMCFTIKDGKPKAPVPMLVKAAFNNNDIIKNKYKYKLDNNVTEYTKEKIDGTVFNASANFCNELDKLYKNILPKGSKRVIMTSADFFINPTQTEKRYFITAATASDEEKIFRTLNKNNTNFYVAKFNGGKQF